MTLKKVCLLIVQTLGGEKTIHISANNKGESIMPEISFGDWLRSQSGEDTNIGDLAVDCKRTGWNGHTYDSLIDDIDSISGHYLAREAAWDAYEKFYGHKHTEHEQHILDWAFLVKK